MRRIRIDPYLILLLVLSLPVLAPLFAPGYFYDAHDGRHSVFYLVQFDASIRDGAFWPRWAMHHNQGYGYPTFIIQAPLGFFLAEFFVLLGAGFTLAAKLTWITGILISAWGMYRLVIHWLTERQAHWQQTLGATVAVRAHSGLDGVRLAAVTAGVLYVYFPYHVLDIYVRGALNDSLLLAWLPWIFLAFDRLVCSGVTAGWQRRLGVAMLVLAGALLTHTFALLSIAPLVMTLVLFRLVQLWRRAGFPWRETLLAAAGGIGALLLSAVLIVPLLAEGPYLEQQVYLGNTYDFRNHFVYFAQFFSPYWGFGYSDDPTGAGDTMGFQLGILLAIPGLIALFTVHRAQRARAVMAYLLVVGIGLLLIMTPVAQPLWEAVPALAVIQFPWRLLAMAGFAFSVLAGLTLWNLLPEPLATPAPESGLLLIALLGVFVSWPYIQAELAPIEPWREDGRAVYQFEREHPDMFGYTVWTTEPYTTTVMTAGYASPIYSELNGATESLQRLEILAGTGEVLRNYSRGESAGGAVRMETPGTVRVHIHYYPGWIVTVDGQQVTPHVGAPQGAIDVDVGAGEWVIDVRMGTTPPRTAGMLISAFMLAGVLALILWPTRPAPSSEPDG